MTRRDFKELYVNLLHSFRSLSKRKMTVSMYMAGDNYYKSPVRLLVIGIALNSWRRDYDFPADRVPDNKEALADEIIAEWDREEGTRRLEWVHSAARSSKRTENTSEFWKLARAVSKKLLGDVAEGDGWSRYIAWTNLVKISPSEGGNPTGKAYKSQEAPCIDILAKELEMLLPTHILVIADTNKRGGGVAENDWSGCFITALEGYRASQAALGRSIKISCVKRPDARGIREADKEEIYKKTITELLPECPK